MSNDRIVRSDSIRVEGRRAHSVVWPLLRAAAGALILGGCTQDQQTAPVPTTASKPAVQQPATQQPAAAPTQPRAASPAASPAAAATPVARPAAPSPAASPVVRPAASPADSPGASPGPLAAGAPGIGATIEQITENPNEWLGRRVTLTGIVDDAELQPLGFVVETDDLLFDEELLVVSANRPPVLPLRTPDTAIVDDDIVQVTGTVRRFNSAEIGNELNVNFPGDLFQNREGELVVVADRVSFTVLGAQRLSPSPLGPAPVPTPSPSPRIVPAGTLPSYGATIDDIIDTPDAWVGQRVTVSGEVEEQASLGPRAIQIADNDVFFDDSLLIVFKTQPQTIADRQQAAPYLSRDVLQVTGTVRRFNREIGFELTQGPFSGFEGRPVLVADQVTFVAIGGTGGAPAPNPIPGASPAR